MTFTRLQESAPPGADQNHHQPEIRAKTQSSRVGWAKFGRIVELLRRHVGAIGHRDESAHHEHGAVMFNEHRR